MILNKKPMFHIALKLLLNTLLTGDINLSIANEEDGSVYEMTREFKCIVNTHWKGFIKDAIKHLLAFGFFPYKVIKDKNSGYKVPRIPLFDTYRIVMNFEDPYDPQLRSESIIDEKFDKDVKFFVLEYPSVRGGLNSSLATLLREEMFVQRLEKMMIEMEEKKVNPDFIVEKKDTQKDNLVALTSRDTIDTVVELNEYTIQKDMMQSDIDALNMIKCIENSGKINKDGKHGLSHNPVTGWLEYPTDGSKLHWHTLPSNAKGTQISIPPGRSDFLSLRGDLESKETAIVGFIKTMFEGAKLRINTDAQSAVVTERSITKWASIVSDLIKEVYNVIYSKEEDNLQNLFVSMTPTIENTEDLTDDQVKDLCNELKDVGELEINFGGLVGGRNAKILLDEGIISWDVYKQFASQYFGIPLSDFPDKRLPTTTSKRKQQVDISGGGDKLIDDYTRQKKYDGLKRQKRVVNDVNI